MAQFPALPLFTDAYLGDTLHLSLIEHGAYLKLLMIAWRSTPCGIPKDDKRIAVMLGISSKKWGLIRGPVLAFWFENNGMFYQKRLLDERKYVEDNSHRQSKNSRARWLKTNDIDHATAYAKPMPNSCQNDAPHPTPPHLKERIPPTAVVKPAFDASAAVAAWNLMASASGLAQVQRLTQGRKAKLRQRLADCGGEEGWAIALAKVAASPFLRGDSERGWKADFDFLLQERSFTKLMEGAYDSKSNGHGSVDSLTRSRREAIIAGLSGELGGVGNNPASGD